MHTINQSAFKMIRIYVYWCLEKDKFEFQAERDLDMHAQQYLIISFSEANWFQGHKLSTYLYLPLGMGDA